MKDHSFSFQVRRLLRSRIVLFVLALFCVWFALRIVRLIDKANETAVNLRRAESEHQALEKQKENLENSINTLSTDEGTEAALRQKYSVVHEGEELTIIVDPDKESQEAAATEAVESGFWGRIFGGQKSAPR